MKKIFTCMALLALSAYGMATEYKDRLTVSVNGNSSTQDATISVDKTGDKYTLSLKNFVLSSGGNQVGVGNIVLPDITGETVGDATLLETLQTVSITAGDDPSIPMWLGPTLPPIPIELKAKMQNNKLYAVINIDLKAALNQVIEVTFGSGYQLPNSGFEEYRKEGSVDEPIGWHSFASATGSYASTAKGLGTYTLIADGTSRPGSSGTKSILLQSASLSLFFSTIIANGTMTTGRMVAGAKSASHKKNHAELNMASTDKDSNGDPFYAPMNGRPDSLAVWVKFTQGKAVAAHPYATVSAAITDGTYYQEPEDKAYTNVLARAQNNKIETKSGAWQRIVVPFNYVNNSVEGKAILVTLSTNADPGQGSKGDKLYVDDIELIYNSQLRSLAIDGTAVAGFAPATLSYQLKVNEAPALDKITAETAGALVKKAIAPTANGWDVTLTSMANDLKSQTVYTLHFTKDTSTGISTVDNSSANRIVAIYNLQGVKVDTMLKGNVYLVKMADGRTVKMAGNVR